MKDVKIKIPETEKIQKPERNPEPGIIQEPEKIPEPEKIQIPERKIETAIVAEPEKDTENRKVSITKAIIENSNETEKKISESPVQSPVPMPRHLPERKFLSKNCRKFQNLFQTIKNGGFNFFIK